MKHFWYSMKILRGMMGAKKAFNGPLWVQIGISNPCNHRCVMCWDHPSYVSKDSPYPTPLSKEFYEKHPEINRDKGFMDLDMLEDLVVDLHDLGTRRVELVGRGEPTMHPEFDKILKLLIEYNFNVSIATNGSLLNEKSCELLVGLGIDRIIVSLNAGTGSTYPLIHTTATSETYDQIVKNLKMLSKLKMLRGTKKPHIALSYVISKSNFHEGIEMVDRGHDVGAEHVVFKYAVPYPNIKFIELTKAEKMSFSSQLPSFLARAKKYNIDLKVEPPIGDKSGDSKIYHKKTESVYSKIPCYIGWYFALITAEGSVSPCCQCMMQLGSLKHHRFKDIWSSKPYLDFREKMKRFPEWSDKKTNCMCDECTMDKINITIYNLLHFYKPVHIHKAQREFSLLQLFPTLFFGKTTKGAKIVKRVD